ncbi:MAG TPA: carbamoyltransferase HypF [Actinomycetes bacterium]|nr:carbamoyltransferase HypF [Actinomycetes bacterium]
MSPAATGVEPVVRVRARVEGVVQGVGFRPFVHRVATQLGLSGFVGNDATSVFLEAEGSAGAVEELLDRLHEDAPPLARVVAVAAEPVPPLGDAGEGFRIVASRGGQAATTLVPADTAVCEDCLREMGDPGDRRHRHPFITCTNCGPRFTIIRDLPYDRPRTTMASFAMCERCRREYDDPADRRFHAQPLACPACGPSLWFVDAAGGRTEGSEEALAAAHRVLREGGIVAVKGIGGYHLACLADDDGAVARLRERKRRPDKPFAVMVRDLATARRHATIDETEAALLAGAVRPIVLLRRRPESPLGGLVAPNNPRIGLMLPYTPVHHLLLGPVPGGGGWAPAALVMTSGNLTDEPICYDERASERLAGIADAFLEHDRPIHLPCDDSVLQVVDGEMMPVRRSRGCAPLPVDLGRTVAPVLATGGELKNTVCLTRGRYAFMSQHLGDMAGLEGLRELERTVDSLQRLYEVDPVRVATDSHPGYATRAWAHRHLGDRELVDVQHHHAHVVSLLAERGRLGEAILGVAFDGTGYGTDGTIWGGELLVVGSDPTRVERVGSLAAVPLAGGDTAVRNPCRVALSWLHQLGIAWDATLPPVAATEEQERAMLRAVLDRGTGCIPTSSMGRLFDAVASLLGVRHRISFEAQAAIELEAAAEAAAAYGASPVPGRPAITVLPDATMDPGDLLRWLADQVRCGADVAGLALAFHEAVADSVADAARTLARPRGIELVGLTGGVFQNALLLSLTRQRVARLGLEVLTHHEVPANDGGLSLGQAVVAALRTGATDRTDAKE